MKMECIDKLSTMRTVSKLMRFIESDHSWGTVLLQMKICLKCEDEEIT